METGTTPPAADPTPAPSAQSDEPTRFGMLTRNPRRLIIALVLILIAVAVAVFATATFTTSSSAVKASAATGGLSITSDKTVALDVTGLVPGDSKDGTVKIENTGSSTGAFTVSAADLTDNPATPPLSGRLTLKVVDNGPVQNSNGTTVGATAGFPKTVFEDTFGSAVPASPKNLGDWLANEAHGFTFTVTFVRTPPAGADPDDNKYQNASTSLNFTWNATSN